MTQNTVKQGYVTSDSIFNFKQFAQQRMQLAQWRENSKGKYVELQIWQKVADWKCGKQSKGTGWGNGSCWSKVQSIQSGGEMNQAFIAESLSMSQQYFIVYSKIVKLEF